MLSTNSRKFGLKLLYDAADRFGVDNNVESMLIFCDLSALSFQATKSFSIMECNAMVSHSFDVKQKISV